MIVGIDAPFDGGIWLAIYKSMIHHKCAPGILFTLGTLVSILAFAEPPKNFYFQGADITAFVNLFGAQMRFVEKPFYLYHWGRDRTLLRSNKAQNDSNAAGLNFLNSASQGYLEGLTQKNRGANNMMGPGLYLAIDPIVSESFGGGPRAPWKLLELRVPKGFRILDVSFYELQQMSDRLKSTTLQQVFEKFECDVASLRDYINSASNYSSDTGFMNKFLGNDFNPTCAELIKHVFSEVLKIDGLLYGYFATTFPYCGDTIDREKTSRRKALVLMSDDWMKLAGAEARLLSRRTKDNVESRKRIESLFYAKNSTGICWGNASELTASQRQRLYDMAWESLKNHPDRVGIHLGQPVKHYSNDDKYCSIYIPYKYRAAGSSRRQSASLKFSMEDIVDFDHTRISTLSPPTISPRLHWDELDGQPILPNIKTWMQENLLNCGSEDFLGTNSLEFKKSFNSTRMSE